MDTPLALEKDWYAAAKQRYIEGGCTCSYCTLCRTLPALRRWDAHHTGIPSYPDPDGA